MQVPLIELDLRLPLDRLRFDRVLFLDIDGVLHPDGAGSHADFCCLPLFVEALQAADARGELPIVVSSAWRHTQRLEAIKGHFPAAIRQQIVGVTPFIADAHAASIGSSIAGVASTVAGRHPRQAEITLWIRRNAPKAQWLAVDDRAGGFADRCPGLFLVPGPTGEGGGPGITTVVAAALRQRRQQFLQ